MVIYAAGSLPRAREARGDYRQGARDGVKTEGGLWNRWEFLLCMKAAPITDRKAERPKISACIRNLTRVSLPGISRPQTTPLSAAAPSLHRFLARIPEPQIRVPNSAHLLLIAGYSSFFLSLSSFPTPSPFIFYFYPSHQPLSSPRPASTGGSQLGSLSFQVTINPNSNWRRQCSIEGSGKNTEEVLPFQLN